MMRFDYKYIILKFEITINFLFKNKYLKNTRPIVFYLLITHKLNIIYILV